MKMSQPSKLETWAKRFVRSFIKSNISSQRYFHNIEHTEFVVENAIQIAKYYALDGNDRIAVTVAAWFHDIGYCFSAMDHESYSVNQALQFLDENKCPLEIKGMVEDLILSTKTPVRPSSLTQEIICDADMAHLGSPNYFMWSDRLKREVDHFSGKPVTLYHWNEQNIRFFQAHRYFTGYANENWALQKERNLQELLYQVGASC